MKIGIFGTGSVARALSVKLISLGHNIVLGTRNTAKTLENTEPDVFGNPPFGVWIKTNPGVKLSTFNEAAEFGSILINAIAGGASLNVLKLAGTENLNGKILIDISNPLDFSKGFPPFLSVCNTDSIGEQIQNSYPDLKVVKALNTMTNSVMINPDLIPGDHNVFMCGNDSGAKMEVINFLVENFGWKKQNIIDLGDITASRGTEMILPIWLRLYGVYGKQVFNFHIAAGQKP